MCILSEVCPFLPWVRNRRIWQPWCLQLGNSPCLSSMAGRAAALSPGGVVGAVCLPHGNASGSHSVCDTQLMLSKGLGYSSQPEVRRATKPLLFCSARTAPSEDKPVESQCESPRGLCGPAGPSSELPWRRGLLVGTAAQDLLWENQICLCKSLKEPSASSSHFYPRCILDHLKPFFQVLD